MTDRVAGFLVTLDSDLRVDDAEPTLAAIRQIRGVIAVEPIESSPEIRMAEHRARLALGEKIMKILFPNE